MIRTSRCIIALSVAAALGLSATHTAQAQVAYGLAGNGTTLVSFNLATPGATTFIGNLSGATTFLNDIDFRASNGLLYGYSQPTNQIVTINTATGVTTLATHPQTAITTNFAEVDFNPTVDRLRIVSTNGQNIRVDPATGAIEQGGTFAYAAGDFSAGVTPFISDVAYTNNDNNPATGTAIYYLDSNRGTLVTSSDPNSGILNTVGSLGVVSSNQGGFDIFTSSGA